MAALWSLLIDELLSRYREVVEHIQFLLRTERVGNLLTINHYFSKTLDKLRSERSAEPIEDFFFSSSNAAQRTPVGNMEHTVRDIHDILRSYYKVASKRFVDNVCMQGRDYHLITGPDTHFTSSLDSFLSSYQTNDWNQWPEQISHLFSSVRAWRGRSRA